MIILANIDGEAGIFYSFDDFLKATFSPFSNYKILKLGDIHGNTYNERKNNARDIAIEYSLNFEVFTKGLSYSEIFVIENFFYKIGKRFGLLREFRENAIC